MYEQIVIALDGSAASLAAAAYVRHLPARRYLIVHVVEGAAPIDGDQREALRSRLLGDRLLSETLAAMGAPDPGPDLGVDIRHGHPAAELIRASAGADALVLTTRGRGVASRALFGSVADEVARRGQRPSLLVRPDHDLRRPERVIVPLDGSGRAERALPVASRLARTIGCPLILVHVVDQEDLDASPFAAVPRPDAGTHPGPADRITRTIDAAAAYLRRHEQALESPELEVQHRVVIGETIPALIEYADPADIVVVASRAHTGLRRLVDPGVAERLVQFAPSPVMIVHAGTTTDIG